MDFTREPIIETVVTPKEGCKLVVRSSKAQGQEEYFVDSVEVVSFGNSVFFRSQERPKAFIVPAADYEVLEVREARMVLKNVGLDRSIKIGGGRENPQKPVKEQQLEKEIVKTKEEDISKEVLKEAENVEPVKVEGKKKDRRRQYRRRRGREDELEGQSTEGEVSGEEGQEKTENAVNVEKVVNVMLAPPPLLISETIARYKDNALFKGAFYTKEESGENVTTVEKEEVEVPLISLPQPEYGSFEMKEEEEEEIYQQRKHEPFLKEEEDIKPTIHFGEEEFPEKDYSHPHHD